MGIETPIMITRRSTRLAAANTRRKHVSTKDNRNKHAIKRPKYDTLEFTSNEPDPILEHLREFCKHRSAEEQQNIDAEVLDQVALEGLSGITLGRLFRILEAIFPALKCTNNESCQHYVWSVIVNKFIHYPLGAGIQAFYHDPAQPQQDLKQFQLKNIIIDKQIRLPLSTVQRVAKSDSSLYPVQDGPIMGSCANYLTRKDISNELDSLGMYDLNVKYGLENVFFVAGQTLRTNAILPNWADPNINIKPREYCALELIGKSRTLGTVFPNDKTLGRYRIMLLAKGFITQFQETNSSPIEHHLKRFFFKRPTSSVLMTRQSKGDSSDEDEETAEQPLSSLFCNPSRLKVDRSTLTMVYDVIAESDGLTQIDIRKALNMPKFHLRNHLKNLLSIKMICSRSTQDAENSFRIYRTVHRNNRRKKRPDQFDIATGIMANWDEIDLRAKKIIGHKRSTFSQAEDSLLILCRIASLLIEPGLKISWCVHKRVVRDILHEKLVESHDKTSDACLRRIKYLKRLPNNIMSINELTAELQDDQDVSNLIQKHKPESDVKLSKLFVKVLKKIRSKIPSLLGIACHSQSSGLRNYETGRKLSLTYSQTDNKDSTSQSIIIKNHKELSDKFELIDCQSVASIQLAPTYEKPKNVVDVKLNTASLVTMAYTLSSYINQDTQDKRASQWLLEKFYSSQHDKLINSVQSRLTKRSLLTRKCRVDRTLPPCKPKTKTSLKLNQSVHFLLNRYHSTSLMQLTRPISQSYTIELSESNEMGSFATLTSLCSLRSFDFDLDLKIPTNVVGIDQGNENLTSTSTRDIIARFMSRCGGSFAKALSDNYLIVHSCNVKFHSETRVNFTKRALESFLDQQQQQHQANWLVKSFRLPKDICDRDFETRKTAVEFEARLWKSIDGTAHITTLLKLIEALLSWIIVLPGVERAQLQRQFGNLMPEEHLLELLDLMEKLELISSQQLASRNKRPRLFGYAQMPEGKLEGPTTYEPTAGAFVRYCYLLEDQRTTRSGQQEELEQMKPVESVLFV